VWGGFGLSYDDVGADDGAKLLAEIVKIELLVNASAVCDIVPLPAGEYVVSLRLLRRVGADTVKLVAGLWIKNQRFE